MKILYCDNEHAGFFDRNEYDFAGRPLNGLKSHDIDFFGLKSWFAMSGAVDFGAYDAVWLYLGHREMRPSWYSFPSLVRAIAPEAKIIFTTDWEGYFLVHGLDLRIKRSWERADAMHVITKHGRNFFKNRLSIPVFYAHVGSPHAVEKSYPEPKPFAEREGVVFVRHSNKPDVTFFYELALKLGERLVGFDSSPIEENYLKWLGESVYAVEGRYFRRLPFASYVAAANHAKVGVDNHVGPSRFCYEMAHLKLPVVHTETCEYGNVVFPTLAASGKKEFAEKIKELCGHESVYDAVAKAGRRRAGCHFSRRNCGLRLRKLLRELTEENP